LGRSRGGLTTKIHLAADQRCRPVAFITSEGQRHDSIAFQTVLELVSIDRLGPGRPRSRPDWVLADKAYSSKAHRDYLAGRGIKAAIPIKDDQAAARRKKGPRGGRPPSFDRERYRVRNTGRCQVVCVNTSTEVSTDDGCCGIEHKGAGGAGAV
jgi:hypothetical protein